MTTSRTMTIRSYHLVYTWFWGFGWTINTFRASIVLQYIWVIYVMLEDPQTTLSSRFVVDSEVLEEPRIPPEHWNYDLCFWGDGQTTNTSRTLKHLGDHCVSVIEYEVLEGPQVPPEHWTYCIMSLCCSLILSCWGIMNTSRTWEMLGCHCDFHGFWGAGGTTHTSRT